MNRVRSVVCQIVCSLVVLGSAVELASGQTANAQRCAALEVYLQGDADSQQAALNALEALKSRRPGIRVREFRPGDNEADAARLAAIAKHFKRGAPAEPVIYGCSRMIVVQKDEKALVAELERLLKMQIFVRSGCPRCARAKAYIPRLMTRYPAFQIEYHDIATDSSANQKLQALTHEYRTAAASVPVFHFCNRLIVGFDSESTSGQRLETALKQWTLPCDAATKPSSRVARPSEFSVALTPSIAGAPVRLASYQEETLDPAAGADEELLPIPGELPLPGEEASPGEGEVDLPLFGHLSVESVGLPAFTLAIGLVDGFNPCAMWVLLFLLSLLVNLKSRFKMFAVAGTFVLISGLAYFAFMAAWLNVFEWVGLLRPVQIALAILAIVVGLIHVKDFFAYHQGITLSIPEAAKPGIYARARRIVLAENLFGAIAGATVLAVLVNMIELLCTAGLPALYTGVLSMQNLPLWQNYAFLALYIAAYMFDDSLMVVAAVATLGRPKMQETHGRWLKLVSGSVILLLGCVMLLKPEWLV